MKKSEFFYEYPEELVAIEPSRPSRVMRVLKEGEPFEISILDLLREPAPGDVWVVNNSQVLPRRVFAKDRTPILFVQRCDHQALGFNLGMDPTRSEVRAFDELWEVLMPSAGKPIGWEWELPGNVKISLVEKGRPQRVKVSQTLSDDYFTKWGELPLPPYIQKLRSNLHTLPQDSDWYQPDWSEIGGSLASPTASLHFTSTHLDFLRQRGVKVLKTTLHIGVGTFLPIDKDEIDDFQMHREWTYVPRETWESILKARREGKKIWALGTTVVRSLESVSQGLLTQGDEGWFGETDLYIRPGFRFQVVDRLMTNFHQPETTLLALVAAVQGIARVIKCYQWAIERRFRLFSYGDLSVWDVI